MNWRHLVSVGFTYFIFLVIDFFRRYYLEINPETLGVLINGNMITIISFLLLQGLNYLIIVRKPSSHDTNLDTRLTPSNFLKEALLYLSYLIIIGSIFLGFRTYYLEEIMDIDIFSSFSGTGISLILQFLLYPHRILYPFFGVVMLFVIMNYHNFDFNDVLYREPQLWLIAILAITLKFFLFFLFALSYNIARIISAFIYSIQGASFFVIILWISYIIFSWGVSKFCYTNNGTNTEYSVLRRYSFLFLLFYIGNNFIMIIDLILYPMGYSLSLTLFDSYMFMIDFLRVGTFVSFHPDSVLISAVDILLRDLIFFLGFSAFIVGFTIVQNVTGIKKETGAGELAFPNTEEN